MVGAEPLQALENADQDALEDGSDSEEDLKAAWGPVFLGPRFWGFWRRRRLFGTFKRSWRRRRTATQRVGARSTGMLREPLESLEGVQPSRGLDADALAALAEGAKLT